MMLKILKDLQITLPISDNSAAAMEHRNAGVRLRPFARPLPAHSHPRLAPEPLHADHHPQYAQAEAGPEKLVHPQSGHLRLLPLQLHLTSDPLVHAGGTLALRLQHKGPMQLNTFLLYLTVL